LLKYERRFYAKTMCHNQNNRTKLKKASSFAVRARMPDHYE
jgi:hypothetical protein